MEQLLVPALIVLGVFIVLLLLFRRPKNTSAPAPSEAEAKPRKPRGIRAPEPSAQLARAGSAQLSEEQHRSVYAAIAQGQLIVAIKVFRQATGSTLLAAKNTVESMERFPQPYRPGAAPLSAELSDQEESGDGLLPPPQLFPYRYRAIASRGDVTREISSNSLNDEIYNQVRDLVSQGERHRATAMLKHYAQISEEDAKEFIDLL